jgi:BMFP domain-containing protein YqiC
MQDDHDDSMPAQDSFIDVVCNMVGVLIILVLIMGMRGADVVAPRIAASVKAAKEHGQSAVVADQTIEPGVPQSQVELAAAVRAASEIHKDIQEVVAQAVDLRVQAELTAARRQQLSVVQAAVERDVEQRRAQLDAVGREQFDVQRQIVAAEIELHELTQQQLAAIPIAAEIEEVECVPTPIARTVDGEEIHVRLRHGQLAVVPVDALLDEVRRRGGDHLRSSLQHRDEAEDVFGPIDGFRMRLTIERYTTSLPGTSLLASPEKSAVLLQGVFLPVSDELGEAVEQALLPDSRFMQSLRGKRAVSPTVTVWVYPDSYSDLRTLKRALWEAGVPMAVRPLSNGQPITFSTAGSKSAAQ